MIRFPAERFDDNCPEIGMGTLFMIKAISRKAYDAAVDKPQPAAPAITHLMTHYRRRDRTCRHAPELLAALCTCNNKFYNAAEAWQHKNVRIDNMADYSAGQIAVGVERQTQGNRLWLSLSAESSPT
jgi:hypothetical protein